MKNIIVIVVFSIVSSCTTSYKCKRNNLKAISEITKSGLMVYIALENNNKEKYLVTTQQLKYSQYRQTKLEGDFIDTLKSLLSRKTWFPLKPIDDLKSFGFVDTILYNKIALKSPIDVYKEYIGDNSCEKLNKYSESEMRAVIFYMVSNCAIITVNQSCAYVVSTPPVDTRGH